jgi:hypothetical protein
MNTVYGDKMLKRKQIFDTLKKNEDWKNMDDRGDSDSSKMVRTGPIILSAVTAIEAGHHISVKQLSAIHMMSFGMTCCFLHKQLGLVKKMAYRVSKQLSLAHDKVPQTFIKLVQKQRWAILG